jgi:parvulin-like peptidyl-prolyl isomerase
MKKSVILLSLLIGLMSCSKDGSNFKLEKGTVPYTVAEQLTEKLPFLNPDSTTIIITTNDFVITSAEVMSNMYELFGNRIKQFMNIQPAELKMTIIKNADELANEKALEKRAEKSGVSVTDAMVDSVLQFQYQQAGGEEKFLAYIQRDSISIEKIKNDIKEALKIKTYLDKELKKQIQISEDEIRQTYNEDTVATVRHILLLTAKKSDKEKAEILKKMKKLLKRAKRGEDFEKLAKKYSEDPGSKERGGLYENIQKGQMVKAFENASFKTPVGEISDIVETQYGYHIVKVIDRKVGSKSYEEAKTEIRQKLEMEKLETAYVIFIKKLREEEGFELNKNL